VIPDDPVLLMVFAVVVTLASLVGGALLLWGVLLLGRRLFSESEWRRRG
jgi:hypothetical protein